MAFLLVITFILVVAALAPRYGVDSRRLERGPGDPPDWPGYPEEAR